MLLDCQTCSAQALILTETLQSANEVFNEAREQRHQQQLHQQQQQQRKKRRYTPSAQVAVNSCPPQYSVFSKKKLVLGNAPL